jgi:hypothetical protein
MGIDLVIRTKPFEIADGLPFDQDEVHSSYEREHVAAFQAGLARAHRALEEYQAGFSADHGPIVFYWGSFDVATSRFSNATESACGWWPLDKRLGPAFYAYTSPPPTAFAKAKVEPDGASWDETLGEFILPYDLLIMSTEPDSDVRAFFETAWRAGQLRTAD